MGWTRENWRENVSQMLFEMGSIKFQKALWQGKIPGLMHSFSELICNVGDYDIPEGLGKFIELEYINKDEAIELKDLSDKIDRFIKSNPNIFELEVSILIADHEWVDITRMSRSLFKDFFCDEFLESHSNRNWYDKWW